MSEYQRKREEPSMKSDLRDRSAKASFLLWSVPPTAYHHVHVHDLEERFNPAGRLGLRRHGILDFFNLSDTPFGFTLCGKPRGCNLNCKNHDEQPNVCYEGGIARNSQCKPFPILLRECWTSRHRS